MKTFWKSKTFWWNLIGIAALILQTQFGFVISPEVQIMILTIINVILRFITKEPISWTNNQ